MHSFPSYSLTNFLTIYFPIRNCSVKFKSKIADNINSFIIATESSYRNPDSLRFVASGWIKETKIVDGEVASGFMFCLMWTDRKSEEQYKSENEHWRELMRYLKGMGMLGEDQFHGKAFQVLGESQRENFEFSDDSSNDDDKMDEQLELMRKQPKRRTSTSTPQLEEVDAPTEAEVTKYWNEVNLGERLGPEDDSGNDYWSRHHAQPMAPEDSDDESWDSTPILTPSSSTMSLNSLFDDPEHLSELPGTWKSDYDISNHHKSIIVNDTSIIAPFRNPEEDESPRANVTNPRYRSESSSDDSRQLTRVDCPRFEELAAELKAFSKTLRTASSTAHPLPAAEKLQKLLSPAPRRAPQNPLDDEKTIPDLMRRYGVPKMDPEEELRNAKSRFWRRSKRLSPPPLERQQATLQDRSSPAERGRPAHRSLTIDPLRNSAAQDRRQGSWWAYVKDCLPNPAATLTASADVEVYTKEKLAAAEEGIADFVTSRYGSDSDLCTLGARDAPLSIEMEKAKVRPALVR